MTHSLRSVAVIRTRAAEFKFFSQFSRGIRLRKRARRGKRGEGAGAERNINSRFFSLSPFPARLYVALIFPGRENEWRRWENKFPCLKTVMDEHGAEELIPFKSNDPGICEKELDRVTHFWGDGSDRETRFEITSNIEDCESAFQNCTFNNRICGFLQGFAVGTFQSKWVILY